MRRYQRRRDRCAPFLLAVTACSATLVGQSMAATWFVDANASGPGNGQSWPTAWPDLQTALTSSSVVSGDKIWVADGTYKPTEGITPPPDSRDASFLLKPDIMVYGGFLGVSTAFPNGEPNLPDRDVHENPPAILDGDLVGTDVEDNFFYLGGNRSDNSYHVVTTTFNGQGMRLDGFTVKGGYAGTPDATSPWPRVHGGGVRVDNSELALLNCTLTQNSAGYAEDIPGTPNCVIWDVRNGRGGALFVTTSSTGEEDVSSDVSVYDCRFTKNHVRGHHGVSAAGGDSGGAGIYCMVDATRVEIVNTLFDQNGGAYKADECDYLWYVDGTNGGALCNGGADDVSMVNCTVADNTVIAGDGQMPDNPGGYAFGYGGGVYNAAGALTIDNCIFWGNTDVNADQQARTSQIYVAGGTVAVNWSDVEGGWSGGTGNINADPLFVNAAGGNYRLGSTSPARNVGSSVPLPADFWDIDDDNDTAEYTPDLDLSLRISNGTVDMGAYEHCDSDVNLDGITDVLDLLAVLSSWGFTSGPADINEDSIVNVLDLLAVLGEWGCGDRNPGPAPESIQDCIDRYGDDIDKLTGCIEAIAKTQSP